MDYNVLKNYFSILRRGGYAVFMLTGNNIVSFPKNVKHPSAYINGLLENGLSDFTMSLYGYKQLWCRFCRHFSFCMLWSYFVIDPLLNLINSCRKTDGLIEDFIKETEKFCGERNIVPVFVIMPSAQKYFQGVKCQEDCKVIIVDNNENLMDYIYKLTD